MMATMGVPLSMMDTIVSKAGGERHKIAALKKPLFLTGRTTIE
jgi:hypothetical protein